MDGQLSIPNGRRQYYSGTQHCGFLGAGRAAALNSQTFYFQTQLFESRNYSDFGFFFICKHNARYIRTSRHSVDVTACLPEDTVQRNSDLGKNDFGVITGVSKKEQC